MTTATTTTIASRRGGARRGTGLLLALATAVAAAAVPAAAVPAAAAGDRAYLTDHVRWDAATGGLAGWQRSGTTLLADGSLALDPATAAVETDPYAAGAYYGGDFYDAGNHLVGEATSPVTETAFGALEAIPSWGATTPAGTWTETLLRARVGTRWTKWYNLGIWASDSSTIERHSVRLQGDGDGYVAVDTLVLEDKSAADALQVKVRLFRSTGTAVPTLDRVDLATSTRAAKTKATTVGNPALWGRVLDVPECSQMVYADGGPVWCSPTSTSMVLGYWQQDGGPCEPRVRAAVAGVYDRVYDGHGNWPFNTAYASSQGLTAAVTRMTGLDEVERWVAAGVPVVISYAWGNKDLTGAPIPSSGGHLAVVVGFDALGNPVVNDPAAADDAAVQRTYDRAELERLWVTHSGGTSYVIHPQGHPVPAL